MATTDRRIIPPNGQSLAGLPVRDDDIEPTRALRSVAMLFRVMSGLLVLLMVIQVINGLTSTVPLSVGVLIAESMRLVIFAGLLWGAGDLAELFVKSHYDLRATRILLGRLVRMVGEMPGGGAPRLDDDRPDRGTAMH
jgi:hypothetical protein